MGYKEKPIIKLYRFENNSFHLIAVIDDYQSCSFERNKYEAGSFTIQINYNIPNASLFEKRLFVQFGNDAQDFGEIIEINDVIGSDGKGPQLRTISGKDARYIFKRRIIKKLNLGSAWSETGKAETVMRNLINDQCGTNAEEKRKLPVIVSSDTQLGNEVTVSEAFTNLYETLTNLATQGEIGWKTELRNGQIYLSFYTGTDRSRTVQFSTTFDSLSDGSFSDSDSSFSNAVYVGGKGNNDDRDIYEGENYISGSAPESLDRFECWDNQSSMTDEAEYEAEANSILSQYSQTVSCDGRGLAQCPYIYKEQFGVGDLITLSFSGKKAVVQILSVSENWSKGQYNIDFSFGKPVVDLSKQLQLLLKKIHSADLEKESLSKDSVRYYTLPDDSEMPEKDVTYNTIGFTGVINSDMTFKLYFRNDGTGAKTYHVYFKNLTGSGKLTLSTGVTGKNTLQFNSGTYVAIIYVDEEGNVKNGIGINDSTSSLSTSWSSEKINNELSDKASIDDDITSSIKTWSSEKINNSDRFFKQYPYRPSQNPYDANTIYTQGIYRGAIANGPEVGYGILMCLPYRTEQGVDKPDFGIQLYFANGDSPTPNIFYRLSLANSWLGWKKIATTSVSMPNPNNLIEQNDIKE